MPILSAIHEVIYTDSHGKRAVAHPGSRFALDDDAQLQALLRARAVRVEEAATLPGTPAALAGVQDADGTTRELSEMTKAELLEIAKGLEIEGLTAMNKAELVAAIQAEEVLI